MITLYVLESDSVKSTCATYSSTIYIVFHGCMQIKSYWVHVFRKTLNANNVKGLTACRIFPGH